MKNFKSSEKYVVEVLTGNESGIETNANVIIALFGDLGDSGKTELIKSKTH